MLGVDKKTKIAVNYLRKVAANDSENGVMNLLNFGFEFRTLKVEEFSMQER